MDTYVWRLPHISGCDVTDMRILGLTTAYCRYVFRFLSPANFH